MVSDIKQSPSKITCGPVLIVTNTTRRRCATPTPSWTFLSNMFLQKDEDSFTFCASLSSMSKVEDNDYDIPTFPSFSPVEDCPYKVSHH
ncbi:hypothetical protein JOB18_023288 [Solea senegalensis]|uniref:Uncharacterized protein n=1 Tax=Solea senegalensis TaxID=28829 RepID=A0AAV6SRC8_SOLSE|nr:hypothetical protein JOB18_023288 [Solea senegalensis]